MLDIRRKTLVTFIALGLSLAFVSGCSRKDKDLAPEQEPTTAAEINAKASKLYAENLADLKKGKYKTARSGFDEIEKLYPYSLWAPRSILMSGFSSFQRKEYDTALETFSRFIELNPAHPRVDYAYYMRALSYFEQISDIDRDQAITLKTAESFEELILRFPQSKYAPDAQRKYELTQDNLAGKEVNIGRYYQKKGHYSGAIGRFRHVIENYQTTNHVPEALHRLTESYLALGLIPEAQTSAAVLGHNYSGSPWYAETYALLKNEKLNPAFKRKGWLTRLRSRLTKRN